MVTLSRHFYCTMLAEFTKIAMFLHIKRIIEKFLSTHVGRFFRALPAPILRGPNAGRWWSIATGTRYFRGKFVPGKAAALPLLLQPGETVWDIGAHRGYTVLLESRLVGPQGRVFAFEPNPDSRDFLERHVRWNRSANVTVFPWAIGGGAGELSFGWEPAGSRSTLACHLGGQGLRVTVKGIDQLIAAGTVPAPTFIKIDIEGAELDALQGAANLLAHERRLAIALATHSRTLHDQCSTLLRTMGFAVFEADNVTIARQEGWPAIGDADVLAFRPERGVSAETLAAFRCIGRHG